VQADADKSYGALNSASITRFNVAMEKMPVSADIFTEDLTIKSPVPGGIVCEDPILPPWFCPTP